MSNEDAPIPAKKKSKGTSGKLRTEDTTVVNKITWPHNVLYTAVYEEMSSVAFVNSYLAVMAGEMESTKASMLLHLQDLMEDAEAYG